LIYEACPLLCFSTGGPGYSTVFVMRNSVGACGLSADVTADISTSTADSTRTAVKP